MVTVNIHKKDLWLLSAIMVFLIAVGYVVAYGSGSPTTMGHDAGEIMITITYTDCTIIDIYNRICNGVPGCSFSGVRLDLLLPAPWVVVGGNYNSPDYTDGLKVCKIKIE